MNVIAIVIIKMANTTTATRVSEIEAFDAYLANPTPENEAAYVALMNANDAADDVYARPFEVQS